MARRGARRRPQPLPARDSYRWLAIGLLAINMAACSTVQPRTDGPRGSSPGSSSNTGGVSVLTTNFQFTPDQLTVKSGVHVEYRNLDKAAHTVTQGRDGKRDEDAAFDEKLARDSAITIMFARAGTFHVTCTIHPTMNQVVIVSP